MMSDLELVLKIPEELVKRARAAGIEIELEADYLLDALETQIRRQEAGKRLDAIIAKIDALPDEMKPTPEEIAAEIDAYWAEKESQSADNLS